MYPRKVAGRTSPTIHLLHAWEGDRFRPITSSAGTAEVLTAVPWSGIQTPPYGMGVWNHAFFHAEEVWRAQLRKEIPREKVREAFRGLFRLIISREERLLELAEKHLSPRDILGIRARMIGTGYIGGKSAGMLVARSILLGENPEWEGKLEALDAFYIPSDVFYTYLIINDCWWIRRRQRDPENFLEFADEARRRILTGSFPQSILDGFERMLEYFGQSPIIVRSSSLLEDSFGNTFAGKYESVFCANSGKKEERMEQFLQAVRIVYVSSMSEEALRHRAERGVLDQDEQMALLVQRVSGAQYGDMFYPQVAGVGFSFNPYAWSQLIDPKAGMVRLVFGLGTRAVSTKVDDYTRLVALNAPHLRPETGIDEVRRYTQRLVDVLDLDRQEVRSIPFEEVIARSPGLDSDLFVAVDETAGLYQRDRGSAAIPFKSLSLDRLIQETPLAKDLKSMLATLEEAYDQPVDIEFTVNLRQGGDYRINLLQCRPLLIREESLSTRIPEDIPDQDLVFQGRGAVVGTSRAFPVDRFIFVVPSLYSQAPLQERYSVARLLGKLNRLQSRNSRVVLMGPGRWGTSTPSLGIPACFAEISRMSVVCELVTMREGFSPDVSLGTHFLSNLVETDILYVALFPERRETVLTEEFFLSRPNRLADFLPNETRLKEMVRVVEPTENGEEIWFYADCLTQSMLCFRRYRDKS
ncbi:MAG: pyruvate, phosphate dikinase [Candidatus Omnitrophica bacterium]|nr:pyruvate, phosphate dikinase [Candidatus Omnitrophota bacterium]